MKKVQQYLINALIVFSLGLLSIQSATAADKAVRECGDMSTAVASITAGVLFQTDRGVNAEPAIYQGAVSYFITRLNACFCRAELYGELKPSTKVACFYQAKALAFVYYLASTSNTSMDENSFIPDEILAELLG